jgi:hypothetical protein
MDRIQLLHRRLRARTSFVPGRTFEGQGLLEAAVSFFEEQEIGVGKKWYKPR